jgi:beta-mannosidase
MQGQDPKSSFLYCELLVNGKVASDHDYFFAPFKDLRLSKPSIGYQVARAKDGFRVTVKSDKFAKAVYLSAGDDEGAFSDNYFDLIPGKTAVVLYRSRTGLSLRDFRERLAVRSMTDAF